MTDDTDDSDAEYRVHDVPTDATPSDLLDEMGVGRRGAMVSGDGPLKVVDVDDRMSAHDRDSVTVTDPTVTHPQDARGQTWGVPAAELYAGWKRGEVTPGTVTVVTDE